jgi:hypothetical protein
LGKDWVFPALFLAEGLLLLGRDGGEGGTVGIGSAGAGFRPSFTLFVLTFVEADVPFFALGRGVTFGSVGDGDGAAEAGTVGVDFVAALERFAAGGGTTEASCCTTTCVRAGIAAAFSAFPLVFEPLPTDSLIFASFARLKAIVGYVRTGQRIR